MIKLLIMGTNVNIYFIDYVNYRPIYNQLAALYCIKKTVGPTSIDSLKLYCNLDKGDCKKSNQL